MFGNNIFLFGNKKLQNHNPIPGKTDPLYQEIEISGKELTVKNNVPGIAVAVIRDGKIAWIQSIGYANLTTKTCNA